jgi:hypothetical protein
MDKISEIKDFKELSAMDYFRKDYEAIQMAARLSQSIRSDAKDIKAGGDEIEIAVRNFYKEKLFPKYHVTDGHILDLNCKVSPQLDIMICESSKNPIFCTLANKSEFVYYETVYAISEIKRSYYDKGLFLNFAKNIERIKTILQREKILSNEIECSNVRLKIANKVTDNPIRNPLFSFMFIADSKGLDLNVLSSDIKNINIAFMPNMTVFLDLGILLNVGEDEYNNNKPVSGIFPKWEMGVLEMGRKSDRVISISVYVTCSTFEHFMYRDAEFVGIYTENI